MIFSPFVDGTKTTPSKTLPAVEGSSNLVANPEYATLFKHDQRILSGLFGSLTPAVLGHVLFLKTSTQVREALDRMFASRSKAKIVQLVSQLVKPKKRDVSMSDYFHHMKRVTDTMTSIGKPLEDDELVSYILAGLGDDFDNFTMSIMAMTGKGEDFTLSDPYGHMTAYEARNIDRSSRNNNYSGGQF
jgi:hypothetical protein